MTYQELSFWRATAYLASMIVFVMIRSEFAMAQVEVKEVRVFDDRKQPVASHIQLVAPDGAYTTEGNTEENGVMNFVFKCPPQYKVVADPLGGTYRRSAPTQCRPTVDILVWSPTLAPALLAQSEREAAHGNYGAAALLSNEAYQRALGYDAHTAEIAREKTILYTAQRLKVPVPVHPDASGASIKPTRNMVDTLYKFQNARGLPLTGKIDTPTLQALSGTTIGPHIDKALTSGN